MSLNEKKVRLLNLTRDVLLLAIPACLSNDGLRGALITALRKTEDELNVEHTYPKTSRKSKDLR
jgi:hypothetical protein